MLSDMFNIKEERGLRLITPKHEAAVANAPWTKETLKYRSRVEDTYGNTVSQGFKKFFNLGSGPDGLRIEAKDVITAAERGDLVATLKVDGSLLIRSVHLGHLMLRTRGSFGYSHLDNEAEMGGFYTKYPEVFDPGRYVGISLLFEWVSPANQIVIKYKEPELTLIGAVRHRDLSYMKIHELKYVAETLQVPIVEAFPLTPLGWGHLQASLESRQDIEGYVLRMNGEQDLVKVKCPSYLTKHSLRSNLTTEDLADLYFQQGEPDFKTFCEDFANAYDEETCLWALGAISSLFDGVKVLNEILAHMRGKAAERKGWPRKEAALAGISEYGQTKRFSAYMMLWEGKEIDRDLKKSILLQNTKQVELGMFIKKDEEV